MDVLADIADRLNGRFHTYTVGYAEDGYYKDFHRLAGLLGEITVATVICHEERPCSENAEFIAADIFSYDYHEEGRIPLFFLPRPDADYRRDISVPPYLRPTHYIRTLDRLGIDIVILWDIQLEPAQGLQLQNNLSEYDTVQYIIDGRISHALVQPT